MGSLSSSTNRMAPHAPPVLSTTRQAEALFSAAASLRVAAEAEALH